MEILLLIGRLLLAVLLGVAGIAKVADLSGSRQAMRGFGLPANLANAFGVILPVAELVTAILLVVTPLAWWGALAALVLLVAFIAGIGANLTLGRTPECHCFGQLHSEPIGWQTLTRNALLALVALWLVWQGQTKVTSGLGAVGATPILTWLALTVGIVALAIAALEGWFLINLLQQNGRLLLRLEALEARQIDGSPVLEQNANGSGLRIGTPAPTFSLAGLHGETLTLESLRALQRPLMLLFVDPNCGPCNALLPEVAQWQSDYAAKLAIVPITRGKLEAHQAKQSLQHLLLQKDFEVAQAYQVTATPSAVLVRPDGTIGSPLAAGTEAIRSLLQDLIGPAHASPTALSAPNEIAVNGVQSNRDCVCGQHGTNGKSNGNGNYANLSLTTRSGELAPAFQLPDLNGNPVDLASFKGHSSLILFWNPGCGYCRQMLDDLKDWEASPPPGAPTLLFVSTGTVEANQAMNLRSQIVLDTEFNVARTFGARGTPSAVLIDQQGRLASDVAAGREAVLALAQRRPEA